MTTISVKLVLVVGLISALSCKKQTDDQIQAPTPVTPDLTISDVKQAMSQQMASEVYNDLDWSIAVVSSLDEEHKNNLIQVSSRSNLKTSLYYSVLNNVKSAYLVTLNLPNKVEKETDIDGSIEIRSVKNQLLRKFTVNNNEVTIESYDSQGFVSPPDSIEQCTGCTLPPAMVTVSLGGLTKIMNGMFYTYGGGLKGYYIQGTSGQYGSGGSYASSYYDLYQDPITKTQFKLMFLNQNPLFKDYKFIPKITKYATYDQYQVVDNKTLGPTNFIVNFQIDKTGHLIRDKSEVIIYSFSPGTFTVNKTQPDALYGTQTNTMAFAIEGVSSQGPYKMPYYVSVSVRNFNMPGTYVYLRYIPYAP